MTDQILHVQAIFRQFKHLPYSDRVVIFNDALIQRQVIESLEYPILETFKDYKQRVARELGV